MTTILQLITAFATTFLLSCNSHSSNTTIIQGRDTTTKNDKALVDTPRSFVRNYGANETNRLFVFVGEKISVDALPHEQHSMDNGFKAKYLIIERVFGHFPQDTIEFVAYDHYGTPSFSNFKNVML